VVCDRWGTMTTRQEIISELAETMVDVFDVDDLVVTEQTSADDVEEWDSLSHVRFVVAVERKYGLKFKNAEIESLKTVGDLADLISKKMA
jgi:acyl carrier protein